MTRQPFWATAILLALVQRPSPRLVLLVMLRLLRAPVPRPALACLLPLRMPLLLSPKPPQEAALQSAIMALPTLRLRGLMME
jgi:hypothetical protein